MTMNVFGRFVAGAIAVSALTILVGCKTRTAYEVVAAPIPESTAKTTTLADIEQVIVRGGTKAGWVVLPEAPGRLSARYAYGQHNATVTIEHDTKVYNIKYRESTFKTDGTSIHKLYNRWVITLDRSIRTELASIGQ